MSLWGLGLGEPHPVSALHGRGSGDLLDAVLAAFPEPAPRDASAAPRTAPGRAGRPAQRRQVQPAQPAGQRGPGGRRPGRRHHRRPGRLAGRDRRRGLALRRHRRAAARRRTKPAVRSTTRACAPPPRSTRPRSPSCCSTPARSISEQDQRVLSMVAESGRALVIAFNKWDLVDADRRYYLDKEIDRELRRIPWALRVNISAQDRPGGGEDRARRCVRRWTTGPAGCRPGS